MKWWRWGARLSSVETLDAFLKEMSSQGLLWPKCDWPQAAKEQTLKVARIVCQG
jgi:hypothetical protein